MPPKFKTNINRKMRLFATLLVVSSLASACATSSNESLPIIKPSVTMPKESTTYTLRAKTNIEAWQKRRVELLQQLSP